MSRKIKIKVIPGAGENKNMGIRNGCYVIKLTAQPEKDKANKKLIEFLAMELKLKKSQLSIVAGKKSRHKEILIED